MRTTSIESRQPGHDAHAGEQTDVRTCHPTSDAGQVLRGSAEDDGDPGPWAVPEWVGDDKFVAGGRSDHAGHHGQVGV